MMKHAVLLFGCMVLLAGCVSFDYEGGTEPAGNGDVTVYTDAARIRQPYRAFGRAVVSGDYRDVSRDRLLTKLKNEAEERGADAVLIVEQQIVPKSESHSVEAKFNSGLDYDAEGSMRQMRRDVDLNYGRYKGSTEEVVTNIRFVRIFKADFLKYTDGQALEVTEP